VFFHCLFVKGVSYTFDDGESIVRTFSKTGPQSVAVFVCHQSGLPINNLDGALCTGRHAQAAAIAALIIYLTDLSSQFHFLPLTRQGRNRKGQKIITKTGKT
jgi:hypothetical protein